MLVLAPVASADKIRDRLVHVLRAGVAVRFGKEYPANTG
jgi:hypothetical protein